MNAKIAMTPTSMLAQWSGHKTGTVEGGHFGMSHSRNETDPTARYFGQVKWFKDHKGYGFISVLGRAGDPSGVSGTHEIFVHHSDVQPAVSTYKTLVKGEYVSFVLKGRAGEALPDPAGLPGSDLQAADVRGAYGGSLMCDCLNVSALTRTSDAVVPPTVIHNGDIMFAPGDDVIL